MIMEQEPLALEDGMSGMLCILDESGDSRVQWSTSEPALVEKAKIRFEELKGQGYLAYKLSLAYKSGKSGEMAGSTGEVITSFDPDAAQIIMHRALVGG